MAGGGDRGGHRGTVTLGTWVLLPEASFAFWGGALQDPARLGPNMGTSNQSLRGFLLRVGSRGTAPGRSSGWPVSPSSASSASTARRAYLAGDSISEVAAVGLMAVLLSPVAWIHHLHWMVVVIFAILGADPLRDRRRLVAAGILTAWFLCRLPWWGISWLNHPEWPELPGRVLQNADTRCAARAGAAGVVAEPHHPAGAPAPPSPPDPGPHPDLGPHPGPRPDRNPHSAAS